MVPLRTRRLLEAVIADATTIDARPRRRVGHQRVATVVIATQYSVRLGISRHEWQLLPILSTWSSAYPMAAPIGMLLPYLSWLRDSARRSARARVDALFVDAKTELLQLRAAAKSRQSVPLTHAVEATEERAPWYWDCRHDAVPI